MNLCVIPVGADGEFFRGNFPKLTKSNERLKVIYSGNVGHCHEINTLISYLTQNKLSGIDINFYAHGVNYSLLRHNNFPNYVNFGDSLDDCEWRDIMLESHVAIITIKNGAEYAVLPSRVYSAMMAGQAIIAICPDKSDLADLIRIHNCGWVIDPGDTSKLKEIIERVKNNPKLLLSKRINSYCSGHKNYDMRKISGLWCDLIDKTQAAN